MSEVEIVKDEVLSIIPTDKLSRYGESRAELAKTVALLADLEMKARNLTNVQTEEQFKEAGTVLSEARKHKKAGDYAIGPYLDIVEEVAKKLRSIRDEGKTTIKTIEDLLVRPLADYDRREKEAKQREEDEINDRRRKEQEAKAKQLQLEQEQKLEEDRKVKEKELAASVRRGEVTKTEAKQQKVEIAQQTEAAKQEVAKVVEKVAADVQTVKVKEKLVSVPGLRRTVEWKWRMVDITKVPREALYPNTKEDGTYETARFPQITALVNQTKDKAKAEAACPGIEVWSTDKV